MAGWRVPLLIPDDWDEQLTVTTDANGVATIPYLSKDMNLLTVSVGGAGIARRALPMPERSENGQYVLKLGETGRLVGIVRAEGGEPQADVSVLVWIRAAGTMPPGVGMPRGRRRATPTEVIEFSHKQDRVRTGPQGAFQTPSELLRGSSYRVSVRREGFEPFVSDWVALDGERATVPPIHLRSLRTLRGLVRDRQGQPVAAARVFLPSREGSTTSDGQGRFELAGVRAGRTFVLAERAGFRFQGWPVDAAAQSDGLELTLARENEEPERKITPAAEALSDQELKVLARRLIEPYIGKVLETGSDFERMTALTALNEVEPERVVELLNGGQIQTPMAVARVRSLLAFDKAARDPAGALLLMEAIGEPGLRASGFVALARALPDSEKARKQALLERAAVEMRTFPQPVMKLRLIAQIMKSWLDLGMSEKARALRKRARRSLILFPRKGRGSSCRFRRKLRGWSLLSFSSESRRSARWRFARRIAQRLRFSSRSNIRLRLSAVLG